MTALLLLGRTGADAAEASVGTTIVNQNTGIACSALGCLAADAVLHQTGCDTVILNGGAFGGYLPPGELTEETLCGSIPEDLELVMVEVTGADLISLLEQGVSHIAVGANERIDAETSWYDGFPQIAGFTFVYDASAPPGERFMRGELNTGEKLTELESPIQLVLSREMLEGAYGYVCPDGWNTAALEVGSLWSLLRDELSQTRVDAEPDTDRISALGAYDNPIFDGSPMMGVMLVLLVCLFAAVPALFQRGGSGEDEKTRREYRDHLRALRSRRPRK